MKRILVVEDDPDIQEMLCAYLRDAGYETGTAGDGLAALDRFHSGVWNLILLDIMLPKVDGTRLRVDPPGIQRARHHAHRPGCGGKPAQGL